MQRRQVLKLGGAFAVACAGAPFTEALQPMPIIDCHIHLFDPTRAGGVPWPLKSDSVIYKPALPARYESITRSLGVVGAIAVEASPLASDNDWVLRQAAGSSTVVGVVGDLVPGKEDFGRELDRLHGNSLFVGIRYGNLWDRDLSVDVKKPGFVPDVRRLAAAGLAMDSANPDPKLIKALLELSQQVPELRMVIDHLPGASLPEDAGARKAFYADLSALSKNPHIFMKLSEVPSRVGDAVPTDVPTYKEKLDALWNIFGEDHILFGSDWPNSDHLLDYAGTLRIVRRYVLVKGHAVSEKFFWKNSIAAYKWKQRRADQPEL